MRTFIHNVLVKWLISLTRWNFQASPRWTDEDQQAFEKFFQSPAGIKLDTIMANECSEQAKQAVLLHLNDKKNLIYASGFAAGFRASWATARIFSAPLPQKEETNEDQDHGQS